MRNVILTGFMGVGKTTVGKILAEKLKMRFVDMDEIAEREEGMSVFDIFERRGEPYFRKKEAEIFRRLLKDESVIISTGGGTFANPDLRRLSKQYATSVCLVCKFENIVPRIEEMRASRPLLKDKSVEEIRELFKIRAECYIDCDHCIEIDGLSPEQVVEKVLAAIKE